MLVPSGKGAKKIDPKKLLEAQVAKQIRDFCAAHGWRPLRMQSGMFRNQSGNAFRIGEPGMADMLMIYYLPKPFRGATLTMWVETKAPDAVMYCRCASRIAKGQSGKCTACNQKDWKATEEAMGALFAPGNSFDRFMEFYYANFGFLHDGRLPGQAELFIEMRKD